MATPRFGTLVVQDGHVSRFTAYTQGISASNACNNCAFWVSNMCIANVGCSAGYYPRLDFDELTPNEKVQVTTQTLMR